MLINDPAVPDPRDSAKLDSTMFKGPAMTYYGRWTYKYEIAAAKGAAGAIIIHETGHAGYPFSALDNLAREAFDIESADGGASHSQIDAWLTQPKAEELLQAVGKDFAALKAAARRKDFVPVSLGARARVRLQQGLATVQSRNVVAVLPGADAARRGEYVVYSAHWDHMGRDTTLAGDQIFNGALDNASGVAQLPALARGFAALGARPPRSIMFAAVTAEEKGLLGAKYFVTNPPGARCHRMPSRERASSTAPTTSNSPSRAYLRCTPMPARTTSARTRPTASRSAKRTPPATTIVRAMRSSPTGT